MNLTENSPALILEIIPNSVNHDDFSKIVKNFTGLLNEISKEICKDSERIPWKISASRGSIVLGASFTSMMVDDVTFNKIQNVLLEPSQKIHEKLNGFSKNLPECVFW